MSASVQMPPTPVRNTFTPAEDVSVRAFVPHGVLDPRAGPGESTIGNVRMAPALRPAPLPFPKRTSATAVIPKSHARLKTERPEKAPKVPSAAGTARPATMLIELELSVSLISAEPRCWRPKRTPVQA